MFLRRYDVLFGLLLNRLQQHKICLFYIIKRDATTDKAFLFQNKNSKTGLCPLWQTGKTAKSIVYTEWAISLVATRIKELWLIQENSCHCKICLSRWMKTYSESRIELRDLQIFGKMLKKSNQFLPVRATLWAEKLGRCIEYRKSWKNTLGKLAVKFNTEDHWIRVLNERSVSDGGNLSPPLPVILESMWRSGGYTL